MTTPTHVDGSPVTLSVPVRSGPAPTAIAVTVRDEVGVIVHTESPAFTVQEGAVQVTIPAIANTLTAPSKVGARDVTTQLTYAAGEDTDAQLYLVRASTVLVPLKNSFMTYAEALVARAGLAQLAGWDIAGREDREAALQLAHTAMCAMRYRYKVGSEGQSRITDFGGVTTDGYGRVYAQVTDISETQSYEWTDYPAAFKTALQRAQVTQADVILKGDPVGDKRRAGIISETIGESSMFFRGVPEVSLAISREALEHLRGYVVYGARIARGS